MPALDVAVLTCFGSGIPLPALCNPGPQTRLLYLYASDTVVVFSPEATENWGYSFTAKEWVKVEGAIAEREYGWPDTWVRQGGRVAPAWLEEAVFPDGESPGNGDAGEEELIPITTRPIKLGNPFGFKKLKEVEASWPDGHARPFKIYGANRLDRWYFLGLASRGHIFTRGSGFRYFKIETFAVKTPTAYLLPTFRFQT